MALDNLARRGRILVFALVGSLATVAMAGAVYASVPSSDGVIHSCFNTSGNPSGAVRVIDAETGAKCAKNEKALNFNQTGPKGDQGIQGIQGIQGVPGADGTDGTNGVDGTDGTNGTNGTDGTNGVDGTSDVHQASNGTNGGALSVSVPAGSYLVMAYAKVANSDTDFQNGVCSVQGIVVASEPIQPGNDGQNLPIMGTVTLASAGTITVDCGGFGIYTFYKRMFVTRVTSIING